MMTLKVVQVNPRTGERRVLVPKHEVSVPKDPPLTALAMPPCECPRCRPPAPKPHAVLCVRCTGLTRQPVQVRVIDPGSGPLRALYACSDCAPHLINAE